MPKYSWKNSLSGRKYGFYEYSANKGGDIMDQYLCEPCGYIYDPKIGDPDNGIAPGTAFEDIPDDWVCPICGLGKDVFVKM